MTASLKQGASRQEPMPDPILCGGSRWNALRRGHVVSIDLVDDQRGRLISRSGLAWVTMEGDPEDRVLAPHDVLQFTGPGRVVIESIGETALEYSVECCEDT